MKPYEIACLVFIAIPILFLCAQWVYWKIQDYRRAKELMRAWDKRRKELEAEFNQAIIKALKESFDNPVIKELFAQMFKNKTKSDDIRNS